MIFDNSYNYNKFPKRLSEEELYNLFIEYKNGNLKAREKLIIYNMRLLLSCVNRFSYTSYEQEELISIGLVGLIKSIDTFNINKNVKFSTYAIKVIRNEILMFFREDYYRIKSVSLHTSKCTFKSGKEKLLMDTLEDQTIKIEKDFENNEDIKLLKEIILTLPKQHRLIFLLNFGLIGKKEYNQIEIARLLNVSQAYISRSLSSSLKIIKNRFKFLNNINQEQKINKLNIK